jgi:hypothetical protein
MYFPLSEIRNSTIINEELRKRIKENIKSSDVMNKNLESMIEKKFKNRPKKNGKKEKNIGKGKPTEIFEKQYT